MRSVPVVVVALAAVSPVLAHHSDAGLDTDSIVMLEGTVTEFRWRNPHIYFTMDVPDASGDTVEWQVQMGSTSVSLRRGWTEDALAPGDRVTVKAHPGRNGRPYALLVSLEVEGGAVLADRSDAPEITAKASTLEGVWMANAAELVSYPGGFDGFFRVELEPTARGAAAMAGYDEFSEDNPESRCVGRPTPG
ncbi:MAG TPA: DUF6152 family protein, partial [Gammaproteobacteria bacterium]|nr:DUF6152 family protein [Gammaproteobacteria bacterium]